MADGILTYLPARSRFGETRRSIPSFAKAVEDYPFRIHPPPLLLRLPPRLPTRVGAAGKKLQGWLSAKAGKYPALINYEQIPSSPRCPG